MESPANEGNLNHAQNKGDKQQMPPSPQKECMSVPDAGTARNLASPEISQPQRSPWGSESKFTQTPCPKISQRKCEVPLGPPQSE